MVERIMTQSNSSVGSLTNEQLLAHVQTLAANERSATAALVAALAEIDERRLYLGLGYSCLSKYCAQALLLCGDAAYNRIRAARVAAKWPIILDWLADGSLSLASVRVLADVLTEANHQQLLQAARHKSRRDVEVLVAPLKPAAPAAVPPSVVEPVREDVYYLKVPISAETYEELTHLQELLRHQFPTGELGPIVAHAIAHLHKDAARRRWARTATPRSKQTQSSTRYIPAIVRREVWQRDSGQCAFVGRDGRCRERGFLEFHHVVPFADGGSATVENIQLRCRAHNTYEAEQRFGRRRDSAGKDVHPTPV
jgi:5-methylcytosine-specific restriction endonuclease McrA